MRPWLVSAAAAAAAVAAALAAADARADERAVSPLEPGDVLEFDIYADGEPPRLLTVEADGVVDVPLVGAFAVEGLTLGEARRALGRRYVEDGFLATPSVSLTLSRRRDVLVLGDVASPGAVQWRAMLTVEQAAGLAGGPAAAADAPRNRLLQRVALQSDLAQTSAEIAREAAWSARLTARLDERATVEPADLPREAAALLDGDFLRTLIAVEDRILATQIGTRDALRAARLEEIDATEREIALLEERRINQEAVMDFSREEADRVQSLVDRGLSVAAESSRVGRMLVTEESVQLGILAQLSQARARLGAQRGELARLDGAWREQALAELQQRQVNLASLIERRRSILRRLALVDELMLEEARPAPAPRLSYRLRRSSAEDAPLIDADPLTRLRPGDVLFVSVTILSTAAARDDAS